MEEIPLCVRQRNCVETLRKMMAETSARGGCVTNSWTLNFLVPTTDRPKPRAATTTHGVRQAHYVNRRWASIIRLGRPSNKS